MMLKSDQKNERSRRKKYSFLSVLFVTNIASYIFGLQTAILLKYIGSSTVDVPLLERSHGLPPKVPRKIATSQQNQSFQVSAPSNQSGSVGIEKTAIPRKGQATSKQFYKALDTSSTKDGFWHFGFLALDPSVGSKAEEEIPPNSMAACMMMGDDEIRLLEWIAYHYTVLPLGYLIIGLDPKAEKEGATDTILDRWRSKIKIDVLRHDNWVTLEDDKGWNRPPMDYKTRKYHGWWLEKNSSYYWESVHHRRQKHLFWHCQQRFKHYNMSLVLFPDSDEYYIYNYLKPEHEDPKFVLTGTVGVHSQFETEKELYQARNQTLHFRRHLPRMSERVTIMDYVQKMKTQTTSEVFHHSGCYRMPALNIASVETSREKLLQITNIEHPEHFHTTSLYYHGWLTGRFTKCMLDMTKISAMALRGTTFVLNAHIPHLLMCGFAGPFKSGNDYISSLFRFNHYRSGTVASWNERTDFRTGRANRFVSRNAKPQGWDNSTDGWMEWFLAKVGNEEAHRLLLGPMEELYEKYEPVVKEFYGRYGRDITNKTRDDYHGEAK